MKLKQLFVGIISLSVILVSCSKEDDFLPKQETVIEPMSVATMSTTTVATSSVTPKAYVFIESRINGSSTKVVDYLKTTTRNPLSTGTRLYSFFNGFGVTKDNFRDLINYYSIPFWNNDASLKVIETEVPQVDGGMDSENNPKLKYNFTTVKIPKGTFNDFGWVTVLIPTSAMNDDAYKQNKIGYYSKNGQRITSSGNNTQTIINTNKQLSSYVINYTGNIIPQGQYRVYSTYGSTEMRVKFNTTNDVYFRGASN